MPDFPEKNVIFPENRKFWKDLPMKRRILRLFGRKI
jgi:hypothetical protein